MRTLLTLALLTLTAGLSAQGTRGLTARVINGPIVGNPCGGFTCAVSNLNAPQNSTVQIQTRGATQGAGYALFVGNLGLCAGPLPFQGKFALGLGYSTLASGTLNLSAPGACPHRAVVSFPATAPIGSTFALQAVVVSGTTGLWTRRVTVTII